MICAIVPEGISSKQLPKYQAFDLASCLALLSLKSADLALVVDRWDRLPDAVRTAIIALVKASGG